MCDLNLLGNMNENAVKVSEMIHQERERREKEQFEIEERRYKETQKTANKGFLIAITALIVAIIGVIIALVSLLIQIS